MKKTNYFLLISLILICNLLGAVGTLWTSPQGDWYQNIEKPFFNPPNFVFGPVWTLLFTLLGISLYLVITSKDSKNKKIGLTLFIIQFILNILWSFLFFGLNNPFLSLIEIVILLFFILLTTIYFYKVNKNAGLILIPYILWVSFATILNLSIYLLN